MKRLLTVLLLVSAPAPAPVGPTTQAAVPALHCPYGSAYADGCSGAPAGGVFRRSNFAIHAVQSGQPSILPAHPQRFNLACVDYACGPTMAATAMADPASLAGVNGCAFSSRGSPANNGAWLRCDNSVNLSITRIDFSRHECTLLYIAGASGRYLNILGNNFRGGRNCSNTAVIDIVSGTAPLNFTGNMVDGDYPAARSSQEFIWDNRTGVTGVWEYNVFLNCPQRCISMSPGLGVGGVGPSIVFKFNYGEGWALQGGEHGEIYESNPGGPLTVASMDNEFNTLVTPATAPAGGATAMFFFEQLGTINAVTVSHNTLIGNTHAGGGVTDAAAAVELQTLHVVAFNAEGNYIDPTGTWFCFLNNIALQVQGAISVRSLTVTSVPPGGAVLVGATVFKGGVQPAKITGQLAGTPGGAGTYALAGPAQTVQTTTLMLNSLIDAANISGNVNLRDGTAITASVDATLAHGQCKGHS